MGHHHAHEHHTETFNKAFALSVGLNFFYAVCQAGFAVQADSVSLLADAGHNLGDVMGLLVAWLGNWLLTRPATKRYSYGLKRTSILAAVINSVILLVTVIWIACAAIKRLWLPLPMNAPVVMMVAMVGIFINASTALLFLKGRHHDINLRGAFWHLMSDALISFGVVVGAGLVYFTAWYWLDPVLSLMIVLVILYGAWELLKNSMNLMLDAVPYHVEEAAVRQYLLNLAGVLEVHDLHIWGLSSNEVALTAHLVMPEAGLTDEDYVTINEVLKTRFNIHHATIQVEKGSRENPCHTACHSHD